MINSIYKVANNLKDKVNNMVEYQKVLKECTSNENWNISNTKLQVLADHSYNWNDYTEIMRHLWKKINSKPKEWRRIYKSLHAMEYLVKNGAPRVVQEIKDDLFKIRALQDFSYSENGTDRGQGVRDKSKALCELLSDQSKLQEEREFARKTRDKFSGISSTNGQGQQQTQYNSNYPAAPASGKYGGFGSEDIDKFGYNPGKFNQVYDPYSKGHSVPTQPAPKAEPKDLFAKKDEEKPKKKKHKKKKKDDSDSDSSDDSSDSSSDDSDEEEAKKAKKSNNGQMQPPSKSERSIQGGVQQPPAQQLPVSQNLIDLLEVQQPAQLQTPQSSNNQNLFDILIMGQAQPAQQPLDNNLFSFTQPQQQQPQLNQQNNSLFQNLNVSSQQQQPQQPQGFQPQQPNNFGFNFMNQQQQQVPSQQQQPQGFTPQLQGIQLNQQQQNTGGLFNNLNMQGSGGFQQPQPHFQQQQQQQPVLNNFNQQNQVTNSFQPFNQPQPQFGVQSNQASFNQINGFSQPQQQQQQPLMQQQQQQPFGQTHQQQQQPTQQQQQNQWSNSKSQAGVWQEGSGLFDLSNLKSGDKSKLETFKTTHSDNHLLTKDEELDKLWSNPLNAQGAQGMVGGQLYNQQQPKSFIPQPIYHQQQFQQQPPQMNMYAQPQQQQFGQGINQQQMQGMGGLQFQHPQFYNPQQQQQQQPQMQGSMMGMNLGQQQQQQQQPSASGFSFLK